MSSRQWVILFLAVALGPFLLVDIYPLVDLYNHAARVYLLAHYDEIPRFHDWYEPAWALLPNLGFDLAAWPLFKWLPPFVAVKVFVLLLVVLTYFGVLVFARLMRTDVRLAAPMAALLSHNYVLGWGFINFLLGFAMALFLLRLTLTDGWRLDRKAYLVQLPLAFVVFLCHGLAFVFYGLMAGVLLVTGWWREEERDWRRLLVDGLWLAGQAIIPVILFLQTPTSGDGGALAVGLDRVMATYPDSGSLIARALWELRERVVVMFTTIESGFFEADLVLNALLFLLIAACWWAYRKQQGAWPPLLPLLAACVLLGIMPPNFFGASYLEIRVPLLVLLALLAGLTSAAWSRPLGMALAVLTIVQSSMMGLYLKKSDAAYQEFLAATASLEEGALVRTVILAPVNGRRDSLPRCQPLEPLLMLSRHAGVLLFAIPGQQPMRTIGRLRAVAQSQPVFPRFRHGFNDPLHEEKLMAVMASDFDYAITCGSAREGVPVPPSFSLVHAGGFFDLYRIDRDK